MTEEEALLYLPVSDDDDLLDEYEAKLFEHKQFFMGRMPISKVFLARVSRLEKLEQAYVVLGGTGHEASISLETDEVKGGTMKEVFNQYQSIRGQVKVGLLQTRNALDLIVLVKQLLNVTKSYAQHWQQDFSEEELKGVIVGKEPDPMDVLKEIVDLEQKGDKGFTALGSLGHEHLLVMESKRLSLLLKMEK